LTLKITNKQINFYKNY